MIIIIDNYDSFVYNIYQAVAAINSNIKIFRNDKVTVAEIEALKPSHIILSPGPKGPAEAGILISIVKHFYKTVPILGICLGHQAIAYAFGASIEKTEHHMHGKSSEIFVKTDSPLFAKLPKQFCAGRYHSLIVQKEGFPSELEILAENSDDEIMAFQHRKYPVFACQYHPESVLSEYGERHFKNFLDIG